MRRALRMRHQRGCAPWHRRVSYLGHAALRDQAFIVFYLSFANFQM
jgi:hypothetical protein